VQAADSNDWLTGCNGHWSLCDRGLGLIIPEGRYVRFRGPGYWAQVQSTPIAASPIVGHEVESDGRILHSAMA
jgi:hypothetical protein